MAKQRDPKYWVIIPAAGIGARMQSDRPKQYLMLQGKSLLAHVVDVFAAMPEVEKVVVVLHAKDYWWQHISLQYPEKVLTTIGGEKRVDSVLLGLSCLKDFAHENDWVLVHDAARPCIRAEDVRHLIKEIDTNSVGGLLGLPVVDTLKAVDQKASVQKTVSRTGLWYAQTPQQFRYQQLKKAIEKALSDQEVVTDESSAIEYVGLSPKMVLGTAQNIKVTFPEDLKLAALFLKSVLAK